MADVEQHASLAGYPNGRLDPAAAVHGRVRKRAVAMRQHVAWAKTLHNRLVEDADCSGMHALAGPRRSSSPAPQLTEKQASGVSPEGGEQDGAAPSCREDKDVLMLAWGSHARLDGPRGGPPCFNVFRSRARR